MYSPMLTGPGPYEKQSEQSEVERPARLTLARVALYAILIIILGLESQVFGELFGPVCLMAFVILALDIDAQNASVKLKGGITPVWLILLGSGIVFSVLAITGAWLLYIEVDDNVIWMAYPGGATALSIYWLWLRYFMLVFLPVCIWLLLWLDKRWFGEVVAPNWYNSMRAKPAQAAGDVADTLGMRYAQTDDVDDVQPVSARPNPPVY